MMVCIRGVYIFRMYFIRFVKKCLDSLFDHFNLAYSSSLSFLSGSIPSI